MNLKCSQESANFLTEAGELGLIAQLFAELEWAHPWIDGQGRTDLILLNGLLAREGLHPCILQEPYYSSINDTNSWVTYLKEGLAKFEELEKA
ncbi:MAG: Fic family protein [Parachlamydiaceae bacterium]|nr:Fic family protein [Parachlamydiaceae bacterium]